MPFSKFQKVNFQASYSHFFYVGGAGERAQNFKLFSTSFFRFWISIIDFLGYYMGEKAISGINRFLRGDLQGFGHYSNCSVL